MPIGPWLTTQQVAEALGVGVSSVKRWIGSGLLDASRTVGNHRRVPLSEAVRFARSIGLPDTPLLAVAGPSTLPFSAIDGRVCENLFESLLKGDEPACRAILRAACRSESGVVGLADLLVRPVMERIGQGWKAGRIEIYQEHQATEILSGALDELSELASRSVAPDAPLALGATPEEDPYRVGLLLGDLVLRSAGWAVRNLGCGLPFRSMAGAVLAYRPSLVFVSVGRVEDPDRFADDYVPFYDAVSTVGAAVVLGGRGLGPELRARVLYASFGERMAHLAEFAGRISPARPPVIVPASDHPRVRTTRERPRRDRVGRDPFLN